MSRSTKLDQAIMSTEKIEPDYDAIPFPSDSSRSRPSLNNMYQTFQGGTASSYPVFHTPVYDGPAGSRQVARRAASPYTLATPRPAIHSRYPELQQHAENLSTIEGVGSPEVGPPGRHIPWNDGPRDDVEKGLEKLPHQLEGPMKEKEQATTAELEYERLQAMDTTEREKYLRRKRIEFHVTCR